jgi:prepilin-type N-terminal cleavage/methylation domain-containing protein
MRRSHRTAIASSRAFSLAELALVLVIIGVLAGIAGPRYAGAVTRYRLDSAAKRIAADLALARANARATSTPQAVVFTVATNSYQMSGVTTLDNRSTTYLVKLSSDPYLVTLSGANFGSGFSLTSTVTFDIYGMPDNPGTIVITSSGMTKTITLDVDSGGTSIQ